MRQPWIDTWKGLLIFLVVAGHMVGSAWRLSSGWCSAVFSHVYYLLYIFHMPAFFLLAGYTWHDAGRGFVSKKFRRLIVPYIVFGVASVLIFLMVGNAAQQVVNAAATSGDNYYADKRCYEWWTWFVALAHGGTILAALGISSLGIMLVHKFVVVALRIQFAPIRSMFKMSDTKPLLAALLVMVVATAVSYFATVIIRR